VLLLEVGDLSLSRQTGSAHIDRWEGEYVADVERVKRFDKVFGLSDPAGWPERLLELPIGSPARPRTALGRGFAVACAGEQLDRGRRCTSNSARWSAVAAGW
jgi:hypothetical protein